MQKTILVFPSAYDLWKYKQVCKSRNIKVDFEAHTLSGEFSKEDIDKAVTDYKGKVQDSGQ